jgi:hypothetical protein
MPVFVLPASDYIIGILAIVLLVFSASDYIIGILAIVLFVFPASDYIIEQNNGQDTNDVIRCRKRQWPRYQ